MWKQSKMPRKYDLSNLHQHYTQEKIRYETRNNDFLVEIQGQNEKKYQSEEIRC